MASVPKWKPGSPVPKYYSGLSVTFAWNEVALTSLLRALKECYPSGYSSMVGHVQAAMESFTPPIEEPTGLGAVVEDAKGARWVRTDSDEPAWSEWENAICRWSFAKINAVRVLSEGVPAEADR